MLATSLLAAGSVEASLMITIEASQTSYMPGDSGYLDLILTADEGTDGVLIYEIELMAPAASGITFAGSSGVFAAPDPYIFSSNLTPLLVTSQPNSTTVAYNDGAESFTATNVNSATFFGVGRVNFSIDPSAPLGSYEISLTGATRFLNDAQDPIPFDQEPATILITAVPEPSILIFLSGATALGVGFSRRKSRQNKRLGTETIPFAA
jgi:hypothetical protein